MTPEETRFAAIGASLPGAEAGKLFGKPCFKREGKAFLCLFQNEMVFKLTGPGHARALAVPGAQLFDPSGKGRPMKEWVQVPAQGDWEGFAAEASPV
ncbi:hypothetical protein EPD60_09080 [Flaviaesturariibacter flavus]|uniref:TfoX N-terminal domain-containing protein n=1 Tax=Flaviaesturariibacter flavus TaxID=2502780 RepID=A0A4R1BB01_9BACT|nr:hypothetical protein [Flaviaesturariibacter flavus]TCJ14149.1 hypothetical protein EPD60_09080 [Flaviaesturariibacter flavus]